MTQLVKPNLSVVGKIGWCLWYAEEVFSTPHIYNTAWEAWTKTKHKHLDQKFPSSVSFPIWFSGANGAGHVAIFAPKGIYSSPRDFSTGHQVWTSIAQVEQKYGVKYVGWSEDLAGVQLIKENNMPTEQEVKTIYMKAEGNEPNAGDIKYYTTHPWIKLCNRALLKQGDRLQGQIANLQVQSGQTSEFNILGKALASLLKTLGYKKG